MDRHAAERRLTAMIPSAYYSWLCDQVARDDGIGRLAAHAALDADWPRTESDKTVLRAYLRGKGLKALVQPLSESFGEFSRSVDTHIHQQAQGMGRALELARAKMAGPAYRAWRALGCPTREKVVALAERGDAAAGAILGLRVLLGVESPANPLFGVRKLAAAFANGFRPAARILELYYSCSLDMEASHDWLRRGARAGDRACVCQLHARVVAGRDLLADETPRQLIEPAELESLLAAHVGDTGEAEWYLASGYARLELADRALAYFQASAEKGWPAAFRDGALLLTHLGRKGDAETWRRRGAEAGELACRSYFARAAIYEANEGDVPLSPKAFEPIVEPILANAESGLAADVLGTATLYERGFVVPRDHDRATAMAAAAVLLAASEAERIQTSGVLGMIAPELRGAFPFPAAIRWILTTVNPADDHETLALVAQAWISAKMEIPPP